MPPQNRHRSRRRHVAAFKAPTHRRTPRRFLYAAKRTQYTGGIRLEVQAEYVCIHSERGKYLMRIPLRELIARLDPRRFEVVHRSHVVNLDHVVEMATVDDRRLELRMADGSTVVASRSASERLRGLAR